MATPAAASGCFAALASCGFFASLVLTLAGIGVGSSCGSGAGAPAPCLPAAGRICTIAGDGVPGDGVDGMPALATHLYLPQDVAISPDGYPTIADWNNHRVRALGADGNLHIVAGIGDVGFVAAGETLGERLNHPTNVTFDPTGRLVVAAWHNNEIKVVVDPATATMTDTCGTGLAGFSGDRGPAATALLNLPVAAAYDPAGNLVISDQGNARIRRVDHLTGVIDTIAGVGPCADDSCPSGDGGPALAASLALPGGLVPPPAGRIDIDAQGNIFVAETGKDTAGFRVRKIDPAGIITTVAGTGVAGSDGDGGPATSAKLAGPTDVAVAPDGSLYIVDSPSGCVRVVNAGGIITTYAGTCGVSGFAGDGGAATAARLDRPGGVGLDAAGNLYIADTHNNRIRVVYR